MATFDFFCILPSEMYHTDEAMTKLENCTDKFAGSRSIFLIAIYNFSQRTRESNYSPVS